MTLGEAMAAVVSELGDAIRISSNGYLSRAAHAAGDHDGCFYMIGSMGLASSIGLGVALTRPGRRVVVLDGDGNVLMNMGTLARIATAGPANFRHVCFDNGVHASTGGQATIAPAVSLSDVARAVGYRNVSQVMDLPALGAAVPAFLADDGPSFLHVTIEPGPAVAPGERIPYEPQAMTERVRRALGASS